MYLSDRKLDKVLFLNTNTIYLTTVNLSQPAYNSFESMLIYRIETTPKVNLSQPA